AAIRRNVEAFATRVGSTEPSVRAQLLRRAPPLTTAESDAEDGNSSEPIGTEQFVGAAIPVPADPTEYQSSSGELREEIGLGQKTNKRNALDLYDDIMVPDDVQVGVYANGLVIGHTDSEFKLDFVSNMFPKSVVTSRIFMSAPQLVKLLDTLERTLQQFDQKKKS
ncbi:MAG: DUF3467 domain-containing protein, partial [Pirellulaceae bacterium]|nr:DUF3467 domain-containing protein [Pirellulaceae bacterium]